MGFNYSIYFIKNQVTNGELTNQNNTIPSMRYAPWRTYFLNRFFYGTVILNEAHLI